MNIKSLPRALGISALALCIHLGPVSADTIFTPVVDFTGEVRSSAEKNAPIHKGSKVTISGAEMIPGQQVTLMRGTTTLNADGPITVDGEGAFSFELSIDADAVPGLQPILVITENPASAKVIEMKISPEVPLSGAENYEIANGPVTRGLYQVAYSKASNAVFVTSAVGRPPVKQSALTKLDAETLEQLAQVAPGEAPKSGDREAGLLAVYGVGVDDVNGNVWVSNTRQNTAAVYRQSDLSLVKQFEPGAVNHARDVVVDEANGRVYISATRTGRIEVFDAKTLEKLEPITIESQQRGGEWSSMALDVDAKTGKMVNVSLSTDELAFIHLATGAIKVVDLPGAKGASGVAYDAENGLAFVASQKSDNLLIVEEASGKVVANVAVGANPLNVTFDPVTKAAYVANRGAGTITVVNRQGEIIANLDAGNATNQLRADGTGQVWAVNKARGADDPVGDQIWRLRPVVK